MLGIDLLGQRSAHFPHIRQNSATPKEIGLSGINGISVITLQRRTRGPYIGVINRPALESSPIPASIAIGWDRAVSLPMGIALYPNALMNSAIVDAANHIRE